MEAQSGCQMPASPPVLLFEDGDGAVSEGQLYEKLNDKCRGIRVFYYNEGVSCDHSEKHDEVWRAKLTKGSLEAGTVVAVPHYVTGYGQRSYFVVILWDCGHEKVYKEEEFGSIRIHDLGPAGYKGEMVFCDICLIPVMGFAWRLAKDNEAGDLYDLCCKHYNENIDHHSDHKFYCNIPSGDIASKRTRPKIQARSTSKKYDLMGLFKGAVVKDQSGHKLEEGEILKIEHCCDKSECIAQEDMRKAEYYNCAAEIIPKKSDLSLQYRNVGAAGRIDVKVLIPGKWGSIFADHHPILNFDLLQEMVLYESRLYPMKDGKNKCFMRFKDGKCNSLTISGTQLHEISDETIWDKCHNLKIVLFSMNNLVKLPSGLESFKETVTLVCIQNNQFKDIPEILYKFSNLQHLSMHFNYVSSIPDRFKTLENLQRLYFGGNELNSLPDIFDSFPHLKIASFQSNFLTSLPQSFTKLDNLTNLNISHNKFTKFPKPLLKLKSLEILDIRYNRIQRLTPANENGNLYEDTHIFLKQLKSILLEGNPIKLHTRLKDIPDKDIRNALIEDYVFRELSYIKPTYALRINVLGESGAGKTSVVQALAEGKYVIPTTEKTHRHTVGIDRYFMPFKMEDKVVQLHIWDHAGDNEYAMMNDLFISSKSLIWIVVNLAKYPSPNDHTEIDPCYHIKKWLLQVMIHNTKPVVWIIGTHTDECHDYKLKEDHIRRCTEKLCEDFEECLNNKIEKYKQLKKQTEELEKLKNDNVPKFLLQHLQIIMLSNTFHFKGFENLKDRLGKLPNTSIFGYLKDDFPVEWEEKIDELSLHRKDKKIISPDRSDELLKYCHEIGEIYWMKQPASLSNDNKRIVYPDVTHLINLLKVIYRHGDFKERIKELNLRLDMHDKFSDSEINECFDRKNKSGIIPERFLKLMWNCQHNESLFKNLIQLFEHYDLIYHKESSEQESDYFFPYLVKSKHENFENCYKDSFIELQYEFKYYLPKFFLQRLAINLLRSKVNSTSEMFENGFKMLLPSGAKLYVTNVCESDDKIRITAFPINKKYVWEEISTAIEQIHLILSSWLFDGHIGTIVMCPNCLKLKKEYPNFIILLRIDETELSRHIGTKSFTCSTCKSSLCMDQMILPYSYNPLSQLLDNCTVVSDYRQFKDIIQERWVEKWEETTSETEYSSSYDADTPDWSQHSEDL